MIYYKKVGRRYVPVAEYDPAVMDSMPMGSTLVTVRPGATAYKYTVDPALAPLIAAGLYAEDSMLNALIDASKLKPDKSIITPAQRKAWDALIKSLGVNAHYISWNSSYEVVRAGIAALEKEAAVLLSNPAVKNAYDEFMLLCKLTKENHVNN